MNRFFSLILLALLLPTAAVANSIDFTNAQGNLSGSSSGLSLGGSTLIAINGPTAVQLTTNVGKGWFGGSTKLSSGDTSITGNGLTFVPEPGSMLFFGTGILGVAVVLRHKSKRRQASRSDSEVRAIVNP